MPLPRDILKTDMNKGHAFHHISFPLIKRRVCDISTVGNKGGYLQESDCLGVFAVMRRQLGLGWCRGDARLWPCCGMGIVALADELRWILGKGGERSVPDAAPPTVAASCLRCA